VSNDEVTVAKVVVDAMGGDQGLSAILEGAARLSMEDNAIQMVLVGHADAINEQLEERQHNPRKIQVVHAPESIDMDEDPRTALEQKPDCSINVAMKVLARGDADALVSAGHTGATIIAASQHLKRLPGIRRAALAAVHPTENRHGPKDDPFALILDVGATLSATAEDLVSFAIMGSTYAHIISDNPSPTVALLSNGTESNKGTEVIKEAHAALKKHPNIQFIGNVEGLDLPRGTADVVVCDGFLGNVVLKMLEGVTEVVTDLAKDAYARKFLWRLGLTMLSQGLRQLRNMTDWKQYGGAPLLGFDQVIIKAHGRSNSRAIRNAIKVAAKAVNKDLSGQIRDGLLAVNTDIDAS
jgi:glycerol-3-phosphate acyltransferase PlsX